MHTLLINYCRRALSAADPVSRIPYVRCNLPVLEVLFVYTCVNAQIFGSGELRRQAERGTGTL